MNDLAVPCPYCGHHTLYKPEGWVEGGPIMCANPLCDSNYSNEIKDAIERSSLGTPEAKALRATVSDEHAARIVARAKELERDEPLDCPNT